MPEISVMADLRSRYLEYLSDYELQPREVPENAALLQQLTFEAMQRDAREREDEDGALAMQDFMRKRGYSDEERHPVEITLEHLHTWAREAIDAHDAYDGSGLPETYVGEFPTGSFNALATRVEEGCLILVNSGLLVLLKQVAETLARNVGRGAAGREDTLATLADVTLAYLRYEDPMYGPLPLTGGTDALFVHQLDRAISRFVIAHEFGHLLAGHLEKTERVRTKVGEIEAIEKSWSQEFEADRIAHDLLLGVESPNLLEAETVKQAAALDPPDTRALIRAVDTSLEMVAPLIIFEIELMITRTYTVVHDLAHDAFVSRTHPPSQERSRRIAERFADVDEGYLHFIHLPHELLEVGDAVAQRARVVASATPDIPSPEVGGGEPPLTKGGPA